MLRTSEVENANLAGTRGRRVRFKAYPSTGVEGAHSKTTKERPMFSPKELMVMQEKFSRMPQHERPKICYEHGNRKPLTEVGQVVGMHFNELDGWMYLDGEIYTHNVRDVEQLIDSGLRGASLCFGVNTDYKQLIEVSLVENPDFEGASVVSYHSADDTTWHKKAYFPAVFVDQMSEQLPIHKLSDGSYVVPHERYLQAARQHVSAQGDDPERVDVIDPSILNELPSEQRDAIQAAMLGESRLASSRSQEQEQRSKEQELRDAVLAVETLTAGTDVSAEMHELLGRTIFENPNARALALVATERLREQEKKIQQLSEEQKKNTERLSAISERAQIGLRMHSAGTPFSSDIWKKLVSESRLDSNFKSSSSSSSSFSPAPLAVHTHSAKRVLDEVTPSKEEAEMSAYRAKFQRTSGLDFWPGQMPHASTKDGDTRVYAHSAGRAPGSAFSAITARCSNAEVVNALVYDILNGKRDVGLPPVIFKHSLLATKPEVFMEIVEGTLDGEVPTNQSAGISGWGTPLTSVARHAPAICGFTGSRRSFVQRSNEEFGKATFGKQYDV